jgi:hypothetical protein
MKKASKSKRGDDLRAEYDFRSMSVVARGPGRKTPRGTTVKLAPDVARTFPDSNSVNRALRELIRIAGSRAVRRLQRTD